MADGSSKELGIGTYDLSFSNGVGDVDREEVVIEVLEGCNNKPDDLSVSNVAGKVVGEELVLNVSDGSNKELGIGAIDLGVSDRVGNVTREALLVNFLDGCNDKP